jgi:hypothetical protein
VDDQSERLRGEVGGNQDEGGFVPVAPSRSAQRVGGSHGGTGVVGFLMVESGGEHAPLPQHLLEDITMNKNVSG